MIKNSIIVFLTLSLMMIIDCFADDFQDFIKKNQDDFQQSRNEYQQYKKKVAQEFQIYQEIVEQEYNQFRDEILKNWDQPEISDKKRWVEYTPDLKTRKIVDFEKENIKVEVIVTQKDKSADTMINKLLSDLLVEDKATAFKRDRLSQNIEQRVIKDTTHVKTDTVETKPILTEILMGKSNPTPKEVEQTVLDLKKKGTIEKKKSEKIKGAEVVSMTIPMPPKSIQRKAEQYKENVGHFAGARKLDEALVFAVIHTESAFNPMARSQIPAYGLMQIVPQSAGMDASELVFGKPVLLAPSYLYNGENNIHIGTTYLHILYTRYLRRIENLESRLYCVIAAYNTGAGNVAKAFVGNRDIREASKIINKMSPDEVYQRLIQKLPHDETKQYLQRVFQRIAVYKAL